MGRSRIDEIALGSGLGGIPHINFSQLRTAQIRAVCRQTVLSQTETWRSGTVEHILEFSQHDISSHWSVVITAVQLSAVKQIAMEPVLFVRQSSC